jgi:hypothetical protein
MGIDKSGSQDLVLAVYNVLSGILVHIADFLYSAARNRNISVQWLSATSIEDPDVANYRVALKHNLS